MFGSPAACSHPSNNDPLDFAAHVDCTDVDQCFVFFCFFYQVTLELNTPLFGLFWFLQDFLEELKQLRTKVQELEGEKSQYERKLRATKVGDPGL